MRAEWKNQQKGSMEGTETISTSIFNGLKDQHWIAVLVIHIVLPLLCFKSSPAEITGAGMKVRN